jgi:hypothetical protein
MYSELKPGTSELQELARQKLVQTIKQTPHLSMSKCWEKTKAENPKLFGDLEAADWMEEDRARERESDDLVEDNPPRDEQKARVIPPNYSEPKNLAGDGRTTRRILKRQSTHTDTIPDPQPNRFKGFHGDMQPPSGSQNPYSTLAEHMALFAKLQGRKKVEATQPEGFICVGGFSNPLF